MRYLLSPSEEELLEWVGELADKFAARAAEHDRDGTFPHDNYDDLRQAGFLSLSVPEEFGGRGASLREVTLALERLAMGCPSTALAVCMHVGPVSGMADLWRASGDTKLEAMFRLVAEGKIVWAIPTAERELGNLITDSRVRAERVDGGFQVSGTKIFATNCEACTHFQFTARYEDPVAGPQLVMFTAPRDAPRITIVPTWDTLGMRATQSNDVEIVDLYVPDSNVIRVFPVNHVHPDVAKGGLVYAMPLFSAIYLGIACAAMEWARTFVDDREKSQDPEVRRVFADMEILLETGRAMLWRLVDEVQSGALLHRRGVQEALANAAITKYVAGNHAVRVVDLAIEVVGGAGFHRRFPLERMYRDVRAGTIMPFNNRDARRLIGDTVLGLEFLPEAPLHTDIHPPANAETVATGSAS